MVAMKALFAAFGLASGALVKIAPHQQGAALLAAQQTPVAEVVQLIQGLASKVEADGKSEQQSYDKYACWCEATLGRKAGDISSSKKEIEDLSTLIVKLNSEIATHGAEMQNLGKAIDANIKAQKEATEVRANGNDEYNSEKIESEQCIGALEAATKVLSGAGAGKKGFLETMQEAQLLSVVAGVKRVLKTKTASRSVSDQDMEIVQRFIEQPEKFMGKESLSAMQIQQNPFGDYAPQSTQIQGILKGMYDSFNGDLEKANADEAEEQKAFLALMATKKAELATLQATLERHTLDKAQKTKTEAESNQARDDTQAQLAADEAFFEETKQGCKSKASDWSERSRLRTEELQGMQKAVEILSSEGAQTTFLNATTTFLQMKSVDMSSAARKRKVWEKLVDLSKKFQSPILAQAAAQFKSTGHFDAVVTSIDKMMQILREEEQDDIEHRDRCQGSENKNKNDMEDLDHSIEKTDKALERMGNDATDLRNKVSNLEGDINATQEDMAEVLKLRNKESAAFVQSLQDDTDAVALIKKAVVTLTQFYKRNNIPLAELQEEPEYSVDPDKAPETSWSGKEYGGRSSESGGIIAILSMIAEDLQIEMKDARAEDATAQKEYEGQRGAMKTALDAQLTTKVATEKELAELKSQIQDSEEFKNRESTDLAGETEKKAALSTDCAWVETHFTTRRDSRKAEMQGLTDAKAYLAGVESGDEV